MIIIDTENSILPQNIVLKSAPINIMSKVSSIKLCNKFNNMIAVKTSRGATCPFCGSLTNKPLPNGYSKVAPMMVILVAPLLLSSKYKKRFSNIVSNFLMPSDFNIFKESNSIKTVRKTIYKFSIFPSPTPNKYFLLLFQKTEAFVLVDLIYRLFGKSNVISTLIINCHLFVIIK